VRETISFATRIQEALVRFYQISHLSTCNLRTKMNTRNLTSILLICFSAIIAVFNVTAFEIPGAAEAASVVNNGYLVGSYFGSSSCGEVSQRGMVEYVELGKCTLNQFEVAKPAMASYVIHWIQKTKNSPHAVLYSQGFVDRDCTTPIGSKHMVDYLAHQCLVLGSGPEKLNVKLRVSMRPPNHPYGLLISDYSSTDCRERAGATPLTTWLRGNICHNVTISKSLLAKSVMASCDENNFVEFQLPNCQGPAITYFLDEVDGCVADRSRGQSIAMQCVSSFAPTAMPTAEPTTVPTMAQIEGAGINVTNIRNLAMWYEADDLFGFFSNGDPVDHWRDKSGNGHHLTNQYGYMPRLVMNAINGHSVVRFTAEGKTMGTQLRGSHSLGADSVSYFVVFLWRHLHRTLELDCVFALGSEFDGQGGTAAGQIGTDRTTEGISLHDAAFTGPVIVVNQTRLISLTYDAQTNLVSAYFNGISLGSKSAVTMGSIHPSITLGSWDASWVTGWTGLYPEYFSDTDIAEVIVYSKAVTEEERVTLSSQLMQKYSITMTL
jgi:hypothetical protein